MCIVSRELYVSAGPMPSGTWWQAPAVLGPHVILTLLLLHLASVVRGQQEPLLPPLPAPQLREVESQLTNLTKHVTSIISDRFRFCIVDP